MNGAVGKNRCRVMSARFAAGSSTSWILDYLCPCGDAPSGTGHLYSGIHSNVPNPVRAPVERRDHKDGITVALARQQHLTRKAGLTAACGHDHPAGCRFEVATKEADQEPMRS